MTRRLVVGVAAVLGLVAVAGAWLLWPRGTTEVTEQEALDDFRDRASTTGGPVAPSTAPVPAAGVYTYRAEGQEEVKLGPLPAETRPLPETVTAIVVATDRGGDRDCFTLTVNLFAEHTEDTTYCVDGAGRLTLDRHVKHQQIGPVAPTAEMTCDPSTLFDPDEETTTVGCTLDLTGGPTAVRASLTGTATAAPTEPLTVGADEVEALPLTVSYEVSGDLSGTWTETLWLAPDHLPVRIERALDLSGPATFTERSTLDLLDLAPST